MSNARTARPLFASQAAWFAAQVSYVKALDSRPERQGAYLRGLAMLRGDEMAKAVELEAAREGAVPAQRVSNPKFVG